MLRNSVSNPTRGYCSKNPGSFRIGSQTGSIAYLRGLALEPRGLALLIDEQLGIADNVDEQDVPDLELHV